MSRLAFLTWLAISLAWGLAVAWFALQSWPHLPLDVSHTDPATRAAFDAAVNMHIGQHAAVVFLPSLGLLGLLRALSR